MFKFLCTGSRKDYAAIFVDQLDEMKELWCSYILAKLVRYDEIGSFLLIFEHFVIFIA